MLELKPDPYRPHVLGLQRSLLTDEASQGSRRAADDWFLSSMIVSSEPTTPSRLRSGNDRRGILIAMAGLGQLADPLFAPTGAPVVSTRRPGGCWRVCPEATPTVARAKS